MALRKSAMQLVEDAMREIETLSPEQARALDPETSLLVDLRDIRERMREGFVPGALHAPRGMLEFWVDPDSPYHKPIFASGKQLVFYCQSGWRSALATKTVQDMGLASVSHIGGGFNAWRDGGGPVTRTDDGREPK